MVVALDPVLPVVAVFLIVDLSAETTVLVLPEILEAFRAEIDFVSIEHCLFGDKHTADVLTILIEAVATIFLAGLLVVFNVRV